MGDGMPDDDDDNTPDSIQPPPGTPAAGEPDDAPDFPLTVDRLSALLRKRIA